MNTLRLQQLIDMLREVQSDTWRATVMPPVEVDSGDFSPDEVPKTLGQVDVHWNLATFLDADGPPIKCGYAACALGHACFDKRFVEQGLKFNEYSEVVVEVPVEDDEPEVLEFFAAAAFFFDIPEAHAEWLFSPYDDYHSVDDVVQRLELYIRGESSPDMEVDDD